MLSSTCQCMYLPNPSAHTECETRLIFRRVSTGLNSQFSFSKTSCHTKVEENSPPYYLLIAGGRIIRFITFPKGISTMWNANSLVEVLNSCRRVHYQRRWTLHHKHILRVSMYVFYCECQYGVVWKRACVGITTFAFQIVLVMATRWRG